MTTQGPQAFPGDTQTLSPQDTEVTPAHWELAASPLPMGSWLLAAISESCSEAESTLAFQVPSRWLHAHHPKPLQAQSGWGKTPCSRSTPHPAARASSPSLTLSQAMVLVQ